MATPRFMQYSIDLLKSMSQLIDAGKGIAVRSMISGPNTVAPTITFRRVTAHIAAMLNIPICRPTGM